MEGKKARKLPDVLTGEEREDLLRQPNRKVPTGLRNLCILRLMLDTGITLSELLNLQSADIDFTEGQINIRKEDRQKNRKVWVGEETLEYLKQWCKISPQGEYLFCTLKGGQLDGRYIREMIKRLSKKAGIKKNIFPHTLRHTFAADLYRETKNIRLVQKALGHADISTTTIYTYLVETEPEELRLVFEKKRGEKELSQLIEKERLEKPVFKTEKPLTNVEQKSKKLLPKYVFKCRCGEIVGRQMEKCPGCGEKIEVLLDKMRKDFQRVNFGRFLPPAKD